MTLPTKINRTIVNRFVSGLTEFPLAKGQMLCKIMKMKVIYLCPEN